MPRRTGAAMNPVPLSRVYAAIVPTPRTPADECPCAACHEERAREKARQDWRNSRVVER